MRRRVCLPRYVHTLRFVISQRRGMKGFDIKLDKLWYQVNLWCKWRYLCEWVVVQLFHLTGRSDIVKPTSCSILYLITNFNTIVARTDKSCRQSLPVVLSTEILPVFLVSTMRAKCLADSYIYFLYLTCFITGDESWGWRPILKLSQPGEDRQQENIPTPQKKWRVFRSKY